MLLMKSFWISDKRLCRRMTNNVYTKKKMTTTITAEENPQIPI